MFFTTIRVLCLCAAVGLSGCMTTQGPDRIISSAGPETLKNSGLEGAFLNAEKEALKSDTSEDNIKMLDTGTNLIYANCSAFFASAGNTQRWLVFSRDTIGAIGTLATSVLAITNGNRNSAAIVALLTGSSFTAIDLYTKDFLFAAENIESVRELTTKALTTHQIAVKNLKGLTYGATVTALTDHQNICSPMPIAALVRDAIKNGKVAPSPAPNDDLIDIFTLQDQKALKAIGELFGLPGTISENQAGALWWLLRASPSSTDINNYIGPALSELPQAVSPILASQTGGQTVYTFKQPFSLSASVYNALDKFSPASKDSFRATIVNASKKQQPVAAAPPGTPVLPTERLEFKLTTQRQVSPSGHIGISIKN